MPNSVNSYQSLLLTYLGPQKRSVALLAGLLLASIGLELVNPQILGVFIDTARASGALSTLIGLAVLFLGLALVTQFVSLAEVYVAANVGLVATNRLRADLMLHCLRLDPAFHNTHTPGELIERVDGDVATLANFFSRFIVQLFGNVLLLAGLLGLLAWIDWRVGLALAVLVVAALVLVVRLRNLALPMWDAARQASAELFGFIEERLSGTEDIRANGATAYVMRRLFERSREVLYKDLKASAVSASTGGTTFVMLAASMAVGLGVGAALYRAGSISLGTVYLIFSYTALLSRPIEQISRQIQDLQRAGASLDRVRQLLALRSTIAEPARPRPLPAGPLAVELDHVSFNYDPAVRTLKDVSLRLRPGEVLGLIGRTGSGKTTLTRLLFRLYDPTAGAVRLGGVDLRETCLADIRAKVGMVTQDIQLFNASVRDNLTFFDASLPDERILSVLEDLGLMEWYRSLPEGLNTRLASGGGGLSAGEAQLLAFARVFLHDPGLVILDEASSRLDPATEQRLEHAVDKLLSAPRRTAIIIAHRLGTVQRADKILILDEGHVTEYGPRESLARDPNSRFAELLRTGLELAIA
jgi:ATP-binding cassette subfamily B protein